MENELLNEIDNKILVNAVLNSLNNFYSNDYKMFFCKDSKKNTSVYEVAISCKLGVYIFNSLKDDNFFENEYKDFSVDMEYNKMGVDSIDKYIEGIKNKCSQNSTDKIRPDIIIHNRKNDGKDNNLCVFEIKKEGLSLCDKAKLEGLTKQGNSYFEYQYGIGLYNFEENSINIDLYKDGEKTGSFVYEHTKGIKKKVNF